MPLARSLSFRIPALRFAGQGEDTLPLREAENPSGEILFVSDRRQSHERFLVVRRGGLLRMTPQPDTRRRTREKLLRIRLQLAPALAYFAT